jgi:hypothetical protein
MKVILLIPLLFLSGSARTEAVYTGSTPAEAVVRDYLGIGKTETIDFIRWKLILDGHGQYRLYCNYGLSKPNTNGFIKGGRQLTLHGAVTQKDNDYILAYGSKSLKFLALNNDLLHILNRDGTPLVGNAGWSYTLSSLKKDGTKLPIVSTTTLSIKDSAVFLGRTPCIPREDQQKARDCYKQKWKLVLYTSGTTGQPANFYLRGTISDHQVKLGKCTLIKIRNGDVAYHLQYGDEHLYLQAINPNVLVFVDKSGGLLVGNEDFSFTINRNTTN